MSNGLRRERVAPARPPTVRNVVVIGGSAGGHAAIREVLKDVPSDIPAALILLLHRWSRDRHLSDILQYNGHVRVVDGVDGVKLREGVFAVIPPGKTAVLLHDHVYIEGMVTEDYPREAINRLFSSVAKAYGTNAIGVILSGNLRDGTDGLRAISQAGGVTIVQRDAKHPSMPMSAQQDWPVTFCLRLPEIGPALDLLARRKASLETGVAVAARLLKERLALLGRLIEQSPNNKPTTRFLTVEVESLLKDLRLIETLIPKRLRGKERAGLPSHIAPRAPRGAPAEYKLDTCH